MSEVRIIGGALPNLPWEERPEGSSAVVWRHSKNPIIGRSPTGSTARVFNSAVCPFDHAFVGVFRADHAHGRPGLHLGQSRDGLGWEIEDREITWTDGRSKSWQPGYAYDPRLVHIEGHFYVTWCTEYAGGPTLGLGRTLDFRSFERLENPTLPFNRNGVLFPRRVNGMYLLLSRPSDDGHTQFGDIFVSQSPDLLHWGRHRRVMSRSVDCWWQNVKVGAGPVPIETSEGWLLFYHGVTGTCNGLVYSFGAALLDLDEPWRVLNRTRDYLLTPELDYETCGFVPNVAFPCATLHDAGTGRIAIYYGAADTVTAVAYTNVDDVFARLHEASDLMPGDSADEL